MLHVHHARRTVVSESCVVAFDRRHACRENGEHQPESCETGWHVVRQHKRKHCHHARKDALVRIRFAQEIKRRAEEHRQHEDGRVRGMMLDKEDVGPEIQRVKGGGTSEAYEDGGRVAVLFPAINVPHYYRRDKKNNLTHCTVSKRECTGLYQNVYCKHIKILCVSWVK